MVLFLLSMHLTFHSLSLGLGVAPSHISLYKYMYMIYIDICHICFVEIPTFWKMTAFLFTTPTHSLLGFTGPCARPQAIGWNGHQSQGNQGLKERGCHGRCPLQVVNCVDKLKWMSSIYGDTFMAKHSTSICQWSWFSIDSTWRILAEHLRLSLDKKCLGKFSWFPTIRWQQQR